MKKLLIPILFILAAFSAYLLFFRSPDGASLPDRAFCVKDADEIQKIFIAHRDGDQFTLERSNGNQWVVNGKYDVFPNAMNNLLDAITRMEIEYIPTRAAIPAIVKDLSALGVKVEIYDRNGQRIRNYYVGGTDPSGRSTYMIVEDQQQPYAMYIPSWEGNLRERFLLKTKDWRNRVVFSEDPEDIASAKVFYPRTPSAGFILQRTGPRSFDVKRESVLDQTEARGLSTGAVERFLIGFEKLGAEAIEDENPRRSEITKYVPFCQISLTRNDGSADTLSLWPYNQEQNSIDFTPEFINKGPFRFFGELNGDDFYLLQRPMLENLLVTYDYFFQVPRD